MIIRRYLVREIAQSFAAVLAVLILVFVSNRFVQLLAEAAAGGLASDVILQLLVLKLASKLGILVPLSLYVGVLLALGRLHRDSEVVAMTAGGFGVTRLAGAVLWLALGFGVLAAGLTMYLAPSLAEIAESITRQARQSTRISGIYPGLFKEYGEGERVFYVEGISDDRRLMSNVFVQVRRRDGYDVLFSERGRHQVDERTGDRYMVLEDGNRYTGVPGRAGYSLTRFARYAVRLESEGADTSYRPPETLPTSELIGSAVPAHTAELQWRLSLPLSTVLLAMLALPLAHSAPGQGRGGKLFTGVLIYFIYTNLLSVARSSVETGDLAPQIGMWPVHAALAGAVLVMLFHHESGGRRFSRFGPRRMIGLLSDRVAAAKSRRRRRAGGRRL